MEIFREFDFEAAHFLPGVPEGHKCRRLHGHSYTLRVHVQGCQQPGTNWVMDFAELKRIVTPLIEELDHRTLNDLPGLENPTAEQISRWVWGKLRKSLPGLCQIVLHETARSGVVYRGEDEPSDPL